jgi:DNA polymerase III delta prime subunit
MTPPAIYGRDAELEQLRQLISRRRSFLLHGPAGVGKTLLLKHLADAAPMMLVCDESSSSQTVFRTLAAGLFARKNRHVLQAARVGTGDLARPSRAQLGSCLPSQQFWIRHSGLNAIKNKSAVSIRGIVAAALRDSSYWIVLDHLQSSSQSFAASLKEVCLATATPLLAVARSAHMEDVGFLLPMFSDHSEKFALRNFDAGRAKDFALRIAQDMQLNAANRDVAIQKIVHYSKGNPGAILAMLAMAASPKYLAGRHVKLAPLYIDFRLRWDATHG